MKKTISVIVIFILIFYMLYAPKEAVGAAADGLLLWYETILPTLLPFAIASNLFIDSNMFYLISRFLYLPLCLLLPISREGSFPVFAGFLFGFPMGSRISAVMLSQNKLSYSEASVIFAITNNMSPVFINSFIFYHALNAPRLALPAFLSLYVPALLIGRLFLHRQPPIPSFSQKNTAPGFCMNFKIMDAAIMNGFETLTKLGGYIMLFSMIAAMAEHLPIHHPLLRSLLIGSIEITNGIQFTSQTALPLREKYLLCVAFTAFGGLSGLAQTSSMVSGSTLPMKRYIGIKLLLCLSGTALAAFLYPLFA